MEEAQEKDMDLIASFKRGKSLTITDRQYNVCSQNQMLNLLVSSNIYGYIFYATETDGLAIIPSTLIDQESRYLSLTSEDHDDNINNENQTLGNNSIIYRSYLPGQTINKNPSFIPYWLSLNSDETILAIILLQLDTHSCLIVLYDLVKLIQIPDSTPICQPMSLSKDVIGGTIQHFAWNPCIPNKFAYIDGLGSVSTFEIDLNSKQLKILGKCDANDDYSSICWSPKGKQIVLVTYDGALELYEPDMKLRKKYPSATLNVQYPPCINVLWLSTHQFLLGFSENSPDDNANEDSFFHILVTYDKDQPPKTQIYNDLFFDAAQSSANINPQHYCVRLNESKIIFCGLSKSLKINALGPNELNQDSLDIWTFADEFRATVKGSTNVSKEPIILTGMVIGLNSTLLISEGDKKLPPCPMLLLANSEGLLQVYYFIHKNSPPICRAPQVIKQIQTHNILGTPSSSSSQASTLGSLQSFIPAQSSANGFSFAKSILTPTPTTIMTSQPKEKSIANAFSFNQPHQSIQTTNGSSIDDLSKSISMNVFNKPTPAQPTPMKSIIHTEQSSSPSISDNKKLLQMVDEFQSKLKSLEKSLSKPSELSTNQDTSLENLTATLNNMTTLLQTSIQSIKSMTREHIESMTKVENACHQIKLSQKENLYHLLKDRELDPWTQSRLDSIKTKYDQLKHDLNVLLQLTHTTIHDKSITTDTDETENEDFLPDLEISLNKNETMRQRIQKRILELSHKVSHTEKDLEMICSKLNTDILSSKIFDSTFNKTTMSSNRPFHSSDAQILSHLQATHPNIIQIRVPPAAIINLSSTIEQKKQSINELSKPITPSIQPSSSPKQPNSPSVDSESFKNMLRIVRTSIDLFSGVTSPDQLQELSNTIATSPLSSTHKSNITPINKTPTIPKTTNLSKTSTHTKPLSTTNILQTPGKSVASPFPTISVTPATPSAQLHTSDAAFQLQQTKPIVQTATDLPKSSTVGDSAIRSLLTNTVSSPTTITSMSNQPAMTSTLNQVVTPTLFGKPSNTSTAQIVSQSASPTPATAVIATQSPFAPTSLTSTNTTSVQSTSPTTRPVISSGSSSFGSRPLFGGTPLNLSSTSSSMPFGTAATTTTSAPSSFGSGFGTNTTTATTSVPSTSPFGATTSSTASSFGGGFGGGTTSTGATTSAPLTSTFGTPSTSAASLFGSAFGGAATITATTSAPSTGIFGTATTSTSSPFGGGGGGFGGSTTSTSPFGSSLNTAASPTLGSPFGAAFGGTSSAPTGGTIFGGFGAASTAPTSTAGSSGFGFNSPLSTMSTGAATTGTSGFGSGPAFGSSFSGFNTQSKPSGTSTGFSFGGFGSQPSDATATQPTFASFGSSSAAPQPSSPGGSSIFGGASGQQTGFPQATSPFGGPPAQSSNSPSFTAYRK